MKKGLTVKININNKYGYGITTGNITNRIVCNKVCDIIEVEPYNKEILFCKVDIIRSPEQLKLTSMDLQLFKQGVKTNFSMSDKNSFYHNDFVK
jgi:hypothetical protein